MTYKVLFVLSTSLRGRAGWLAGLMDMLAGWLDGHAGWLVSWLAGWFDGWSLPLPDE